MQKRAEDKEAALKLVVDELTGVERQIHAMNAAVFGNYPCFKFSTYHPYISGLPILVMIQELALAIWALTYRRY